MNQKDIVFIINSLRDGKSKAFEKGRGCDLKAIEATANELIISVADQLLKENCFFNRKYFIDIVRGFKPVPPKE